MARNSYQYGTSPRKYEPEYRPQRKTNKKIETQKYPAKEDARKRIQKQKIRKEEERKSKTRTVVLVVVIFAMLLTIIYREISIMEMFNQKKTMENNLAIIEKENGQVEKNIKEEESRLDWNYIKQVAVEQLGMQAKKEKVVDLEKKDNVETTKKYIEEEKTSLLEKIVGFFIK